MSYSVIHNLNITLGTGAIFLQAISALALLLLFFGPPQNRFLDFIDRRFLLIGFLFSLFTAVFSLVYSEVVGFLPCALCWYQRVFLFPLPFLFGVALWRKDRKVINYALPLLLVGFVISVYQNFVYYFGNPGNAPCDASGISCYQRLVSEFGGYISIPMLSLTAFFSLIVLLLTVHFYSKRARV